MQPRTFDKQEVEETVAAVSAVKDARESVPQFDGRFYTYNVNGSLLAYEVATKYVYVWGINAISFYLIDEEILKSVGSMTDILRIMYNPFASLDFQYSKLSHTADILSVKQSQ